MEIENKLNKVLIQKFYIETKTKLWRHDAKNSFKLYLSSRNSQRTI